MRFKLKIKNTMTMTILALCLTTSVTGNAATCSVGTNQSALSAAIHSNVGDLAKREGANSYRLSGLTSNAGFSSALFAFVAKSGAQYLGYVKVQESNCSIDSSGYAVSDDFTVR